MDSSSAVISRRQFIGCAGMVVAVSACGGAGEVEVLAAPQVAGPVLDPAPTASPGPALADPILDPDPTPSPEPVPGVADTVTTLNLRSVAAGGGPYSATVLALLGQVPSGQTLVSPDDPSLRAAVLSRWPDKSAAVLVVAGSTFATYNDSRTLGLRVGSSPSGELPLGAAQIAATVNSVVLDCGSLGRATLSSFTAPERIWWSTSQNICARYRAPVVGHDTLEMVVDVHAYADGRAFVELVVENAKLNPSGPVAPLAANYAVGVVSVNGLTVATVNGGGAPEGVHVNFRAWYASTWVGRDPGLHVTQSTADLQRHPLLFKCARDSSTDLGIYASETYMPWIPGRHRGSHMGAGGDHPSIGALTQWDARAMQSGDERAWRAVEANALAILGFALNYRDSGTGAVPTFASIGTRSYQNGFGGWPMHAYNGAMGWEVAHHPAVGLMAFIGRPSPVFIELAQKVAMVNGTWGAASTPAWTAGLHGYYYQVRGRAWCLRSLAHATFLTPDGDPWKASARTALANNVAYLDAWRTDGRYILAGMCDSSPTDPFDHDSAPGFQASMFQFHFMTPELHKLASARLLSGAQQATLEALADWCALHQVRWVNEQPDGGWRFVPYRVTVGNTAGTINSLPTWGAERARAGNHGGNPSAVAGTWMSHSGTPTSYAAYVNAGSIISYPGQYWAALVAARERNVPGADQAWRTVQSNITNLETWLNGFADDPRWGPIPRNL